MVTQGKTGDSRQGAASSKGQTGVPALPAWRQPPPESRSKVRRRLQAEQRVTELAGDARGRVWPSLLRLQIRLSWRHWVILLGLTATAVGVSQLLINDYFRVAAEHTLVRGSVRIPAETIYTISGVNQRNIFLIHPAEAESRLANMDGVAGVDVHLRLPNRVILDVTEFAPLVAVRTVTETLWLGTDGAPIPMRGAPPELTLKDDSRAALDDRGHLRPKVRENLIAFRAARPNLTDLYYGKAEGLYFRAPEGPTVYLGEEGQMAAKLALLEATSRKIAELNLQARIIDLRFEGYAALRQ